MAATGTSRHLAMASIYRPLWRRTGYSCTTRSWTAPPGDAALGFSPLGKHTSPRREHPQPANSALLPLRDGGGDGARYVRFRGEPDIAGDVGTSGKNTGPRRKHPQLSDAARNP